MQSPSTAVIIGSSRSHGDTRLVIDHFLPGVDLFDLNSYKISYYDYAHANADDDFLGLIDQLVQYDQVVLASPVYWYSMSAIMKTFFDRLTDLLEIRSDLWDRLKFCKLYMICCSPRLSMPPYFEYPFRETATYMEMQYGGGIHVQVVEGKIQSDVNLLTPFFKQLTPQR